MQIFSSIKTNLNARKREKENIRLLEIALKNNRLYSFLLGNGIYRLDGGSPFAPVFNTSSSMYVIYSYYSKHKSDDFVHEFQSTLEYLSGRKAFGAVYCALSTLDYQLSHEKNGTAPFQLNNEKIIAILKENIMNNKDFYQSAGELKDYKLPNGMYYLLEDFNCKFIKEFNMSIL